MKILWKIRLLWHNAAHAIFERDPAVWGKHELEAARLRALMGKDVWPHAVGISAILVGAPTSGSAGFVTAGGDVVRMLSGIEFSGLAGSIVALEPLPAPAPSAPASRRLLLREMLRGVS